MATNNMNPLPRLKREENGANKEEVDPGPVSPWLNQNNDNQNEENKLVVIDLIDCKKTKVEASWSKESSEKTTKNVKYCGSIKKF